MENLTETRDFSKFDPEWYLQNFYGTDEASNNVGHDLDTIHKIFNEFDIRGKRLLDVGTGPVLLSVISASSHVDEIYLSDYAEPNIQYLKRWLAGEISHPAKIIEHVIGLEGSKATVEQRENDVRKKIRGILPIDITREAPLGDKADHRKFDVIISIECLESAAQTVADYRKCIDNISSLLETGGYLILGGDFEAGCYQVAEYKYRGLCITKKQCQSSVVAFHSSLSAHLVDPKHGATIIMDTVTTNEGQGYNGKTGVFKCPLSGGYVFFLQTLVFPQKWIETEIVKNGQPVGISFAGSGIPMYFGPGSNQVIISLQRGDTVWVRVHDGYHATGTVLDRLFSTFSGFMLN